MQVLDTISENTLDYRYQRPLIVEAEDLRNLEAIVNYNMKRLDHKVAKLGVNLKESSKGSVEADINLLMELEVDKLRLEACRRMAGTISQGMPQFGRFFLTNLEAASLPLFCELCRRVYEDHPGDYPEFSSAGRLLKRVMGPDGLDLHFMDKMLNATLRTTARQQITLSATFGD